MGEGHPGRELLERLMRGELEPAPRRRVIRHLLAGCARCQEVTRALWVLGDEPAEEWSEETEAGFLHPASYHGLFERVLPRAERLADKSRNAAPRYPAEHRPAIPAAARAAAGLLREAMELLGEHLAPRRLHAGHGASWEEARLLLVAELFPLLQSGDVRPGAVLALLVLRHAVETGTATAALLLEMAGYLARTRRPRPSGLAGSG